MSETEFRAQALGHYVDRRYMSVEDIVPLGKNINIYHLTHLCFTLTLNLGLIVKKTYVSIKKNCERL